MELKPRKKSKPKPEVHANSSVEPEVEPSISASSSPETSVPPTTEATMSETQTSTETITSAETQPTAARPLYAWEVPGLPPSEKLQLLITRKAENATTITELTQKLARAEEEVAGLKQSLTLLRTVGSAIDAGLLEFNIGTAPRAAGTRGPRVPAPTKDAVIEYFQDSGNNYTTVETLATHFGCSESTLRGVLTGMVSYGDLGTATAAALRAEGASLPVDVKARTVFYARA